jgi:predicted nucleic acid-binding protein
MGVVVFDSDILIEFLDRDGVHHTDAVECVRASMALGTRHLLCAVNYAEIMVGPVRAGTHETAWRKLVQFSIETITVDMALAKRAAAVRARMNLKLPAHSRYPQRSTPKSGARRMFNLPASTLLR